MAELKEQITSGAWPVGSQIPSENALVETLGVSRTPVREAIRSLAQVGMLKSRQGLGTFVMSADINDAALGLAFENAHQAHVLQVREGLDITAARLAAQRAAEGFEARLEDALDRRLSCFRERDASGFVGADQAFHLGVAEASGNPVLHDLYRSLVDFEKKDAPHAFELNDATAGDHDLHVTLYRAILAQDVTASTASALALLDHTRAYWSAEDAPSIG